MKKAYKDEPDCGFLHEPVAAYLQSAPDYPRQEVIRFAREGLSSAYVLYLAEQLSLSVHELAGILYISVRTIQRWELDKTLDVDLSSKAIMLARIHQHGSRVFGDVSALGEWLHNPVPALQGHTPLSFLDTPFGFEIIHQVLGRLEEGVFA